MAVADPGSSNAADFSPDSLGIVFSRPSITALEEAYVLRALRARSFAGGGAFTRACEEILERRLNIPRALLTSSGTHALEMAVLLSGIGPGDEVVMPSFTFSSTANAVALFGGRPVFVDIDPATMNIDPNRIEQALTPSSKAIIVVHYAGIGCEMDQILEIARRRNVLVIEDAAHAVFAEFKGKALGTLGDFGCFSFHESKNFTAGEGGALLLNRPEFILQAEILREKGTNRAAFFRGDVDKYTWLGAGSSYLMSDVSAALLLAQLERAEKITARRLQIWERYARGLANLAKGGAVDLARVPIYCKHNAHIFYVKVEDLEMRGRLIAFLRDKGILATFHYVPLHSSPAGRSLGEMRGDDFATTVESERLVRLPMYVDLTDEQVDYVIEAVYNFFD